MTKNPSIPMFLFIFFIALITQTTTDIVLKKYHAHDLQQDIIRLEKKIKELEQQIIDLKNQE